MSNKTFSKEINELWDWVCQTNLNITYSLIDLRCMAKSRNIKGYYKMNKVTLYEKLLDGLDKYDRITFILRIDNNTLRKSCENENKDARNMLQTNLEDSPKNANKTKKYFCAYGRYKYSCRACQCSLICSHGRHITVEIVLGRVFVTKKDASIFVKTAKVQEYANTVNRDLFVGRVKVKCFANTKNEKIIVKSV